MMRPQHIGESHYKDMKKYIVLALFGFVAAQPTLKADCSYNAAWGGGDSAQVTGILLQVFHTCASCGDSGEEPDNCVPAGTIPLEDDYIMDSVSHQWEWIGSNGGVCTQYTTAPC